jgi:uncharacterized membrane protein
MHRFKNNPHLNTMMYEILLLIGATGVCAGLILLRISFSPVLHPDAEFIINLLSTICSENGTHET